MKKLPVISSRNVHFVFIIYTTANCMKIIIADNSDFTRNKILSAIRKSPISYETCQCASVHETIDACLNFKPQVILMSADLLGGNSMDILYAVKVETISPMVIVFVDSGLPQVKQQFLNAGADYVFDKSTELDTILEIPCPEPI